MGTVAVVILTVIAMAGLRIASISEAVAVRVRLVLVVHSGTVVDGVKDAITVAIQTGRIRRAIGVGAIHGTVLIVIHAIVAILGNRICGTVLRTRRVVFSSVADIVTAGICRAVLHAVDRGFTGIASCVAAGRTVGRTIAEVLSRLAGGVAAGSGSRAVSRAIIRVLERRFADIVSAKLTNAGRTGAVIACLRLTGGRTPVRGRGIAIVAWLGPGNDTVSAGGNAGAGLSGTIITGLFLAGGITTVTGTRAAIIAGLGSRNRGIPAYRAVLRTISDGLSGIAGGIAAGLAISGTIPEIFAGFTGVVAAKGRGAIAGAIIVVFAAFAGAITAGRRRAIAGTIVIVFTIGHIANRVAAQLTGLLGPAGHDI